jgi:hypothetical protein
VSPEEAVCERLLEIGDVTALVDTRVYLDKIPQQAEYPLVLVQLVHEPTAYHLRGGMRDRARVQVDAYVKDVGDAGASVIELADAIHGNDAGSGLSGWVGLTSGSPSMRISGILRIERDRGYEPDELRILRQRQDYWVFFRHNL